MQATAIFYCLVGSTAIPTPLPTAELLSLGFEVKNKARILSGSINGLHKSSSVLSLTASNKAGERIKLEISWLADPSSGELHCYALGSSEHLNFERRSHAVPAAATKMPSGLPPGHVQLYSLDNRSSISINVQTLWASVRCSWMPKIGTSNKGFAVVGDFDRKAKMALVEKVIRHTLANAAGIRVEATNIGSVAGHKTSRAKRRGSSFMFGDLTQWANASGWTLSKTDEYGVVKIKKGSDWAVLPLGADQIKVKGVWKEMGDSAAFFNGKLYLPEAGLKHLQGA